MNKPKILVIDDEPQLSKLLEITLEANEYSVKLASTAKEGLVMAKTFAPELLILDLGLPDKSGHDVLVELRSWYDKPVLVLSVMNNEHDIVKALDNGASDYLSKPFRSAELLARIRSALRRHQVPSIPNKTCVGDLEIDYTARTISKNGQALKLTSTEYQLMALFFKHEGRVLTHQFLLKEVWGLAFQTETQYLRVFIASLRKKIESNYRLPKHILTESGVGYRFV